MKPLLIYSILKACRSVELVMQYEPAMKFVLMQSVILQVISFLVFMCSYLRSYSKPSFC